MNKTKSILMLLLIIPFLAFAGGGQEKKAHGPVTIKWFMRWDNARIKAVAQPVIKTFEKANPDIHIELENIGKGAAYYTKLNTLAAAGNMPDVTYLAPHMVAIYASKKAIIPIDDYMKKNGINESEYYKNVINFYKQNGKLYGLPIDAAALVVFYNTDMFDSLGVPYPKKGWTWKDLRTIGKKFVKDVEGDGKIDQFAIHLRPDYWPVYLKAETDHTVFNDYFHPTKYLMTQPESIKAFQGYCDMWLVDKIAPLPTQVQQIKDYFMAGKAGMIIVGSWNMPKYIANIKSFKWNIAPLPIGSSGKEYNRGDGSAFCVSAHSKNPDAAFKFVKFLAGPGSKGVEILLDRQQMLPALKSMAESDRFLHPDLSLTGGLKLNKEAFFFGNKNQFSMYDPISYLYEKINAVHKAELPEAWNGKVSAEVALKRAAEQINEILKEAK